MNRRQFNKIAAALVGQIALAVGPFGGLIRRGWAGIQKRVLDPDTKLSSLLFENPAHLDPKNLPVTPVDDFGTMGLTEYDVDLNKWRLTVGGAVKTPMTLGYSDLKRLPAVERKALLICPGVFAYYALWKGVSIAELLGRAGVDTKAAYVDLKGPPGDYEKVERFPLAEARADKVFLAYAVNGRDLPEKHGFPLRAVAEDRMGSVWVKYVQRVEAVIGDPSAEAEPPGKTTSGPAYLP